MIRNLSSEPPLTKQLLQEKLREVHTRFYGGDGDDEYVWNCLTHPWHQIRERPWGNVLELDTPWNAEIEELAEKEQIRGLGMGPQNRDLSFLAKFPDLESFSYLHDKGIDTQPINGLTNLRRLYFANVSGPKIDFRAFSKLEE